MCGARLRTSDRQLSSIGIDRRRAWVYRSHILRGLNRMYRGVGSRRLVDTPPDVVARARTIRAWNTAVVVPRYGFASVEDYHARASFGPLLPGLRVRAAWFGARHDPMVAADAVLPSLGAANGLLDVRWFDRGGHVGFPDDVGGGCRWRRTSCGGSSRGVSGSRPPRQGAGFRAMLDG
jgi:predicted alpha/beta-fold hydrolase